MKYNLRSLMRFSIRDLVLVTVVVAVCTSWWLERTKLRGEIVKLKKQLATPNYTTYQRSGRRDGLPIGDY